MNTQKKVNVFRFKDFPQEMQAEIIGDKLRDLFRQGLYYELALSMVEGENTLIKQAEKELYTIDGVYVGELD